MALPELLIGLLTARNTKGNQVVHAIATAMPAMTATRRNGSSAALMPLPVSRFRCQRTPASHRAINPTVNALNPNSSVYQVAVQPRNSPAAITEPQPARPAVSGRSPARRPDQVSTSIGGNSMVIIAESHLTFHSFTEKDYFFFDLFSCKPFDVEAARQFIMEAFDVREVETHYAERGRDFPRSEVMRGPATIVPLREERPELVGSAV